MTTQYTKTKLLQDHLYYIKLYLTLRYNISNLFISPNNYFSSCIFFFFLIMYVQVIVVVIVLCVYEKKRGRERDKERGIK